MERKELVNKLCDTVNQHISIKFTDGEIETGYNLGCYSKYDTEEEDDSVMFETDDGESTGFYISYIESVTVIDDGTRRYFDCGGPLDNSEFIELK